MTDAEPAADSLAATPRANRIHIAFFGLRNAGKSTLVNAFTGQDLAIVSEVAGTTTDPVSKAMEILPLGPCLVTDTAGLDDVGELGAQRVRKTLDVLATTDVAVWVSASPQPETRNPQPATRNPPLGDAHAKFLETCRAHNVTVLEFRRGDCVAALREKIAALRLADDTPGLLDGLVSAGDRIVCVCPIDGAAPKGRIILPQVQLIRAALDLHATCAVCQVAELAACLPDGGKGVSLVVTDSQAFRAVRDTLDRVAPNVRLTSFSVLFARQKGDLAVFQRGLDALRRLKDGDRVLIAEGCTHHRQCGDIGSEKIPRALAKMTGRRLEFAFASGNGFSLEPRPALVVHCGGCMLTRRAVMARLAACGAEDVPVVNYGMLLAAAAGVTPCLADLLEKKV